MVVAERADGRTDARGRGRDVKAYLLCRISAAEMRRRRMREDKLLSLSCRVV